MQCLFPFSKVVRLYYHNLPGIIWYLYRFVHHDAVDACIFDYLINKNPGGDTFTEVVVFDENSEREDFSLFASSSASVLLAAVTALLIEASIVFRVIPLLPIKIMMWAIPITILACSFKFVIPIVVVLALIALGCVVPPH